MFIIDLPGTKIEIRDLDASIKLAQNFIEQKQFHGQSSLNRLEETRQDFWRDILDKLLLLRNVTIN